jgi:UDP-N-acetylglucosamine--N-acetylmuramyl-(pentapeptide) pyrophosphoryl-undecaprenol N-acetylglucosamine transferase
MMREVQSILIMAGGTGGHVFPGLAVANYCREHGIDVHWLGTRNGIEAKLVPDAGFPIHFIEISGLRGKGWASLLKAPWRLIRAIYQAQKVIRRLQPDAVLGMGGFVSGPGGIASWLLGTKLVIHEQNAKAGLTNRWLAKIAARVLEGFPDTFDKRNKVVTTGNPVRKEIALLPAPAERLALRSDGPRILVLGGSLGAQAINQLLPRTLARLPVEARPEVYHQTGEKHFNDTIQAYAKAGVSAKIVPFIIEMDQAYAWADFVICRAGALTIAELCAAGVGAVLVPFPYAVDDHQTANAHFMASQHAALLVQQSALSEEVLETMLQDLCCSADKRRQMAEAAYHLRKIDAVEKVCKEVCH